MHPTKVTGEIIKPVAMVFFIILMGMCMKVNSKMTKPMAKVITITRRAQNSVVCGEMT